MLKFGNIVLTNNSNWLNIPEHNVITSGNHGTVTASPNKGIQGTEVTLNNTPDTGYEFSSYSVTGATLKNDNQFNIGTTDVNVNGNFTGIVRSVTTTSSPVAGGSITASPNSGIIGTEVTLSNTPAEGYNFNGYVISGATLSGNTFTIGESDVSVTGKFVSGYGYYYTSSTAACSAVPISAGGRGTMYYYIPIIENMLGPYGYGGTYTYNIPSRGFYAIASKVYDGITALTLRFGDSSTLSIGDNTFNNLTALTLSTSNASYPNIYIGNNSLNNVSGLISLENTNYTPTVIGDNSCSDIIFARNSTVTQGNNNICLKVGVNSLKKFAVGDDSYIYLPSGNIGSDLTVAPLVKISANRLTLRGDVKTCMYESAVARGATVNANGNLRTAGYVIDYQGSSNNQDYRISCPDCSSADLSWLNGNKYNFVTGNSYKSYVEFTN